MTRRRISQAEHARLRRRAVAYARLAAKALVAGNATKAGIYQETEQRLRRQADAAEARFSRSKVSNQRFPLEKQGV
jgi:hypothetical protein